MQNVFTALSESRGDLDWFDRCLHDNSMASGEMSVSLSTHLAEFRHFTQWSWLPYINKVHKALCMISMIADTQYKSLASYSGPPKSLPHHINFLYTQLGGCKNVNGSVLVIPEELSRSSSTSSLPSLLSKSSFSTSSSYFPISSYHSVEEGPVLIEASDREELKGPSC